MKYILFLLTILGILLRLAYLYHHDVWFDESFTYFISIQSLPQLLTATGADNNPPLYYLIIHYWIKIFGESSLSLRIPSLMCGLLLLPTLYYFTKKYYKQSIAVIVVSIACVSPLLVYFSSEARMYSLFTLLSSVSTFLFLFLQKKYSQRLLFLFVISFTLTLYTHYYAYLLFLPFFIILRKKTAEWIFYLLIPFFFTIPWLIFFTTFHHPNIFAQSFITSIPATAAAFFIGGTGITTLRTYFEMSSITARLLFALPIIIGIFFISIGVLHYKKSVVNPFLIMLIIPILILYFINFFIPIYSVRSLIFLSPYCYIIMAFALSEYRLKFRYPIFMLFLFLSISVTIHVLRNFRGPPLAEASKTIPINSYLLHTSVLTYYPFLYLHNSLHHSLITQNPLSEKTIEIIGGKTSTIPLEDKQIIIVSIDNGTPLSNIEEIKKELYKNYRLQKEEKKQTITVSFYSAK